MYHLVRIRLYLRHYENSVWLVFTHMTYILNIWFHIFAITVRCFAHSICVFIYVYLQIVIIKFVFQLSRLIDTNGQSITGTL